MGDRIRIRGGYDMEPKWLCGQSEHFGIAKEFIPGGNSSKSLVIKLDGPISFEGTTGKHIVLSLRYVGAKWKASEVVHIELCDFAPESKPWEQRQQGKWVESHASYKRV